MSQRLPRPTCPGCGNACTDRRSTRCYDCYRAGQRALAVVTDAPMRRRSVRVVRLRGTGCMEVKALRERLKKGTGLRRYVYKAHDRARHIVVANHEIPGRDDLIGVYDRNVTAAMVRQDILNEEAECS